MFDKVSFKKTNLIVGWSIFILSSILYYITMAPTVSLWDCGEFIACMNKLEVGHSPGAPFYLLLGRLFNLFAFDASQLAFTANLLSVFASAATVMLLYFSAEHILQRIFKEYLANYTSYLLIVGSSAIGAFAFAVSDTFWFSAVEAEVYALSIFFTALCFWLFLKWEEGYETTQPSTKWLVLIAYLTGLSVGVHLLNLLIIPVLVLIILLRDRPFSWLIFGKAILIGGVILGVLLFGIIQKGLWLAAKLELLFVNGMNLPLHSGLIAFTLIIFGGLFYIVFKTRTKNNKQHLLALFALVFMIGYSSYAMIIIRANANTPINLNDPSNVFSFDGFLNREQYAQNPLLHGAYFNAKGGDLEYETAYRPSGDRYEKFEKANAYKYDSEFTGLFPRMHSSSPTHIYGYSQWSGVDPELQTKPSFVTNLRFFFNYQIQHMYFRYFMWNFAGRQNDEQGHGSLLKGNWSSGLSLLDKEYAEGMLPSIQHNNPSHNRYYLLPFLLGLAGIILLLRNNTGKKYLSIIGLLFLMTGPVIILYLNQTPFEPRERDYAFAGSFFAFSIFLSIGAFALVHWMRSVHASKSIGALTLLLTTIAVPVLMLSQNYDDHDRSGRELALKMARSYLASCEQNAILFTYGDNDTYPLWYVQEVEGYRTDIRVINYGLMGADWCVKQLGLAVNDAGNIPLSIPQDRYKSGDLDHALLMDRSEEYGPLGSVVQFIGSENEQSKLKLESGMAIDYSPVNKFSLANSTGDTLKWTCSKRVLYKNDIALLDILATNQWKRPVYFTIGADPEIFLGMKDYLRYDGMVYRLMPTSKEASDPIYIDTEVLFDKYINTIDLGDGNAAYYDHYCRRTFDVMKHRQMTNVLAADLLEQGRIDDAQKVILKATKELPVYVSPEAQGNTSIAHLMYAADMKEEANEVATFLLHRHLNNLIWMNSLPGKLRRSTNNLFQEEIQNGESLRFLISEIKNERLQQEFTAIYKQLGLDKMMKESKTES